MSKCKSSHENAWKKTRNKNINFKFVSGSPSK